MTTNRGSLKRLWAILMAFFMVFQTLPVTTLAEALTDAEIPQEVSVVESAVPAEEPAAPAEEAVAPAEEPATPAEQPAEGEENPEQDGGTIVSESVTGAQYATVLYETQVNGDIAPLSAALASVGEPLGALPEAPAFEGCSFLGWFVEVPQEAEAPAEGEEAPAEAATVRVKATEDMIVTGDMTMIASYYNDAYPVQQFAYEDERVALVIDAPEGALPAGIVPVLETTVLTEAQVAAVQSALSSLITGVSAVDISFVDENGEKVQPLYPVTVTVTRKAMGTDPMTVVHITESAPAEGAEAAPAYNVDVVKSGVQTETFTFEAANFSIYAFADVKTTVESLMAEGSDFTVTLNFVDPTEVPANAQLEITEIGQENENFLARMVHSADVLFENYGNVALAGTQYLNLRILVDGAPFQPVSGYTVQLDYQKPFDTTDPDAELFAEEKEYDGEKLYPDIYDGFVVFAGEEGNAESLLNSETLRNEEGITQVIIAETNATEFDLAYIYQYQIINTPHTYGPLGTIRSLNQKTTNETSKLKLNAAPPKMLKSVQIKSNDTRDVGSVPDHNKTLERKSDGTYRLGLSVTGDADTDSSTASNVNVIIVYDASSSMYNYNARSTYGAKGRRNNQFIDLYKLENGRYVLITEEEQYQGTVYRNNNGSYSVYTGDRYTGYTRADAGEKVVYDFTNALFGYQNQNDPSNIEEAVIRFNSAAHEVQDWTHNKTDILGKFHSDGQHHNSTSTFYGSGTNWEAGLIMAIDYANSKINAEIADPTKGKADPTFVIFITDGAPYRHDGKNDGSTPGSAPTDSCGPHYWSALNEALQVNGICEGTEGKFYGIYAFGDETDYLPSLMYYSRTGTRPSAEQEGTTFSTAGYYNASDTSALNHAIDDIFHQIVQTLGVSKVSIGDGTTSAVTTSTGEIANLLVVEDTFEYWLDIPVEPVEGSGSYTFQMKDLVSGDDVTYTATVSGSNVTITWTIGSSSHSATYQGSYNLNKLHLKWTEATDFYNYNPPTAQFANSKVDWNLNSLGTLLDGVTYTVTFDAYPSQYTLDLIADLKNGVKQYDELDQNIRNYLVQEGNDYVLNTNTTATLTYTDTREENPQSKTSDYVNPPAVPLAESVMSLEKTFEDDIFSSSSQLKISFYLLEDEHKYPTDANPELYELDESDNWQIHNIYIAPGQMDLATDTIHTTGHKYTLKEVIQDVGTDPYYGYNYEFIPMTVRPMITGFDSNDQPIVTMLILDDGKYYTPPAGAREYTIDGERYYIDNSVNTLIGTNYKTAELDITKHLIDNTGEMTEEQLDAESFTYKITLTVPAGKDASGIRGLEFVPRLDEPWNGSTRIYIDGYQGESGTSTPYSDSDPAMDDSNRFKNLVYGRWYAQLWQAFADMDPETDRTLTFYMTLDRDEVIRITALPSGTTYRIEEVAANLRPADNSANAAVITSLTIPASAAPANQGYEVTSQSAKGTASGAVISGTIDDLDTRYYNVFTNTKTDTVDLQIGFNKHLENYEWSGERYYFNLVAEGGAPAPAQAGSTRRYTSQASGTADSGYTFGNIRFTEAGTYTYQVYEDTNYTTDPADKYDWDRVTLGSPVTLTVTVEENADHSLTVTSVTGSNGEDTVFTAATDTAIAKATTTIRNEMNETSVTVNKVWTQPDGGHNAPADATVTFQLFQDGTATENTIELDSHVDENGEATAWAATFSVPAYKTLLSTEEAIAYTVIESVHYEPYEVVYPHEDADYAEGGYALNGESITNELRTAPVIVKKTFTGITESQIPQDFQISGGGYTLKTTDTDVQKEGLVYTWTIPDVTIGTVITFTESNVAVTNYDWAGTAVTSGVTGMKTLTDSDKAANALTVAASGNEVDFTNTYTRKEGSLTVSKTVVDNTSAADPNKTFAFTVTLSENVLAGYTTTPETITVSDPTGPDEDGKYTITFNLKNGESVTLSGLPVGATYTTAETEDPDFTKSVTGAESGSITTDGTTVAYTNTRKAGTLTIKKKVVDETGADLASTAAYAITVKKDGEVYQQLTFTGAGSQTLTNVPRGTYTVEETTPAANGIEGYIFNAIDYGTTTSVTIQNAADSGELTVTNKYIKLIDVTVTKSWDDQSNKFGLRPDDLTLTLLRNDADLATTEADKWVKNENNTWTYTWTNLPKADADGNTYTYTIAEKEADVPAGYTVSGTAAQNGGTITNSLKVGSLKVTKTVSIEPATAAANKAYTFTVQTTINGATKYLSLTDGAVTLSDTAVENTITWPADGTTPEVVFPDLPVGSYIVTEQGTGENGAAQITNYTLNGTFTGTGEVTASETPATVGLVNNYTRKEGKLIVSKTVQDTSADRETDRAFAFTVTVSENVLTSYATTPETITVSEPTGPDAEGKYTITFSLKNGESVTLSGLPVGATYTVAEDDYTPAYTTTVPENASGSIVEGETGTTVAFNNIREVGSLTVKKVTSPASIADTKAFPVEIKLGDRYLNANGSFSAAAPETPLTVSVEKALEFTNLPIGNYTVTELLGENNANVQVEGYRYDSTTTVENATSVTKGETAEVTITNNYTKLVNVIVEKTFSGIDKEDLPKAGFEINTTITETGKENITKALKLTDTEGLTVSEDELKYTWTIEDVAVGATFAATEKTDSWLVTGYTWKGTTTESELTVNGEGENKLSFTNPYEQGSLKVTKSVNSDAAADHTTPFSFTVTLGEPVASDWTKEGVTVSEDHKTLTFTLTDGGEMALTNLPADVSYTVTEATATGFNTTDSGNTTGTVPADGAEVAFTNTRLVGEIQVTKEVESKLPSDKSHKYEFTVTLSDTTISGTYGGYTFNSGEAKVYLSDGETAHITGLPNNVTATVTETAVPNMTTKNTEGGTIKAENVAVGGAVTFTNTRKEVDVKLQKNVQGNLGDRSKTFTFTAILNDVDGKPLANFSNNTITTDDEGNVTKTISLKHGQVFEFGKLPVGAQVIITENDPAYDSAGGGTETKNTTVAGQDVEGVQNDMAYTFTVPNKDCKVIYTNERDVEVDTGVATDVLPYVLLLGFVTLAGAGLLMGRRRRRAI